jgi:integrase
MKRNRRQDGSLVVNEQGTAIYIRYRLTEPTGERKQMYTKLCDIDGVHYSSRRRCKCGEKNGCSQCKEGWITTFSRPVEDLRVEFMTKANKAKPSDRLTIDAFWTDHYLPWAESHFRKSTLDVMKRYYACYIKKPLGDQFIGDFRPAQGVRLLEQLGRHYTKSTLSKVKEVCISIFDRAIMPEEIISVNPWYQIKLKRITTKAAPKKQFYTFDESHAVLKALDSDTEAKLVFALSAFMGLRPEETTALMWDDLSNGRLYIQRTCVRGDIQSTKTETSENDLPVYGPVRTLFVEWRQECEKQRWWPGNGWVFPTNKMKPRTCIQNFAQERIAKVVRAKGLPWKTLYAGRRGAITTIIDETNGNIHAGQELARHKNANVTLAAYKQTTGKNVEEGVRMLERLLAAKV